jgi:hypothetical protein
VELGVLTQVAEGTGSLQLPRELVIKFMFQGLNFFLKFLNNRCGHIKNPAFRGEISL